MSENKRDISEVYRILGTLSDDELRRLSDAIEAYKEGDTDGE